MDCVDKTGLSKTGQNRWFQVTRQRNLLSPKSKSLPLIPISLIAAAVVDRAAAFLAFKF